MFQVPCGGLSVEGEIVVLCDRGLLLRCESLAIL
jgi:hypothetical protein